MQWIDPLVDWAKANDAILWWSFAVSLALLLLSPMAVAWVAVKLPTDYFTTKKRRRARWLRKYPGAATGNRDRQKPVGSGAGGGRTRNAGRPGAGAADACRGIDADRLPRQVSNKALARHAPAGMAIDQLAPQACRPRTAPAAGIGVWSSGQKKPANQSPAFWIQRTTLIQFIGSHPGIGGKPGIPPGVVVDGVSPSTAFPLLRPFSSLSSSRCCHCSGGSS